MTVATQELQNYLDELWFFLDGFDRSLQQKRLDDLRARCLKLWEQIPDLPKDERLSQRYAAMSARLGEMKVALEEASHTQWQQSQVYLRQRQLELSRSYEHWIMAWRSWVAQHGRDRTAGRGEDATGRHVGDAKPSDLRPLRHARTVFHIAMALVAVGMYQFVLSKTGAVAVLGTLLAIFGSLEITRRIWPQWNVALLESPIFKPIARPSEFHKVNSATYYLIALLMITPFFSRPEVLTGILILGFADPAAAWLGKNFGKRKLYGKKTLVGFCAFVITGFVVSTAFLAAFYGSLPLDQRLLGAFAAAFVGGIVELVVSRIDDNLAIPLAAVTAASLFF